MNRHILLSSIAFLGSAIGIHGIAATPAAKPDLAQLRHHLAALSVPFVPNAGQWDARAAFAAHTFAGTLFVTIDGQFVYRLPGKAAAPTEPAASSLRPPPLRTSATGGRERGLPQESGPGWVLTETLVDGHGHGIAVVPAGEQPQVGKVSFAIGHDASKHKDGLPSYERVRLGAVYPGIDVQLRATGTNVEKIFTVAPHADPTAIQIRLDGAQRLEIGSQGELIALTGNGPVTHTAPIAYQEDAQGRRSAVPVRYALDTMTRRYGFAVGDYDRSRPLVIDPLLQSTYLGGSGYEQATALAIHPATGEVYVAGYTTSTDFPKVVGAAQPTLGDGEDAFVTRFNAMLKTRLQSTYLGGNNGESAYALAIHPATGEIYVAGYTMSSDFPGVTGAEQTTRGGGLADAFVTRFNATLTEHLQSTYLGGGGADAAVALAIHPATGEVYVAGATDSTDFPKVAGAEQTIYAGGRYDAFVTRLNAALTTRLQSTYLGGNGDDRAYALSIHPATGEVYVAGYITSTDFPKVAGAEQMTYAGGSHDSFVTRLNAALTTRLQSTYLGGGGDDRANALAIHPATGEIYVAGDTTSTDFPGVAGAEQTAYAGGAYDAFVTRLNAALTTRLQSTYLGGNRDDSANALAIHPATGEVYVAGSTSSTAFPKVAGAAQATLGDGHGYDAFVTRLNRGLTTRLQSTYLGGTDLVGGSGEDGATALAIHYTSGEVYVAGYTYAEDFPNVGGAEQATYAGGSADAFVSRFSLDLSNRPIAVEYRDVVDFPNSPGGHFFYSSDPAEQANVDNGGAGAFARTGRSFLIGGAQPVCRFYGSVAPGPNSHFYTIDAGECNTLRAAQVVPPPASVQQWNYEGTPFNMSGLIGGTCQAGTQPIYRAYNNAYPAAGPKNPWDSNHRYTPSLADIGEMVAAGWVYEGIAFCAGM